MIVFRSRVMAEAVTAIAGIVAVAGLSRICLNAVMPSIPGSWMSIKMRSGWRSRASRTPSSPVSASATRYPLTCSTSRTSFRFLSLSSTMRISSFAMAHRQRERERRSCPDLALYPDPPVVQLDELPSFIITPPLHRHELMVGTLRDVIPGTHQRLELREGRVHLPRHGRLLGFFSDDLGRQLLEIAQHRCRQLENLDLALELCLEALERQPVLHMEVGGGIDLHRGGGMVEHPP